MGLFFQLALGLERVEDVTWGGGVGGVAASERGCREEEVNTPITFNTLINVLLARSFSHSVTWGEAVELVRSSQESHIQQLCEKTSRAVFRDQSAFAENLSPHRIPGAHISVCVHVMNSLSVF